MKVYSMKKELLKTLPNGQWELLEKSFENPEPCKGQDCKRLTAGRTGFCKDCYKKEVRRRNAAIKTKRIEQSLREADREAQLKSNPDYQKYIEDPDKKLINED